jgi:anti-anti-sigma factor
MVDPQGPGRFVVSIDAEQHDDGRVVLRLEGEADHSNSTSLTAAWLLVAMDMPERIVLDCERLRFVDSAALRVMREMADAVDLEVRGADASVSRLMTLAGLRGRIALR